jgi:hypothetical protein
VKSVAAVFALPAASVPTEAATEIVTRPSLEGVHVVVYTAPLPARVLRLQPLAVTSPSAIPVIDSSKVAVTEIAALYDPPVETWDAVREIPGAVMS